MATSAKTVVARFLGDTANLEAASRRAATVYDQATKQITAASDKQIESLTRVGAKAGETATKLDLSAKSAADAAAKQAAAMGASADKQVEAAGRAAAAFTEASAKMSAAQKAAGESAVKASATIGQSLDEQRAAYARAVAAQGEYEASTKRAADAQVEAGAKTDAFGQKLAGVGKWALIGAAGVAGASVDMAMKFQTATASIAANAGISQKAAADLGNAFLSTAGHSTFSGQQMAQAYAAVAGQLRITQGSALSNAQALNVMHSATDLAEASQISLGSATSALANVMQAYHLQASQSASATNILFNTSKSLAVPVAQVATAVDRLHGRLGILAPSLTDTSTLMTEMAMHGVTGSRGVMMVNTAMQTLVGQSAKTTATLQALGVNVFNSAGRFIGLQSVIQQLQPKFAQMTQQQQVLTAQTIFGKGASQAMLQVIQSGAGVYAQATQAVTRHNAAQQAAKAQSQTLRGEMETLKATVLDLGTKFGNWLVPKLQAVAQAVSSVIGWFEKHKTAAEALAAVIGGVLSVAVGVFAVNKIASMIGSVQSAAGELRAFAGTVSSVASSIAAKFSAISAASEGTAGKVATSDTAMEGANTTAGASFTTMAGEADAGAAGVGTAAAGMATGVEAADTAIESANVAAGASFAALATEASAAAAVVLPFIAAYEAFTSGSNIANTTSRDAAAANNFGMPGFNANGTLMGGAYSNGQFSYKGNTLGGFPTSGGSPVPGVNVPAGATSGPGLAGLPSGGGSTGSKGTGSTKAKTVGGLLGEVAQFLGAAGFDRTAIAGIYGNALQESSDNPNAPGGGMWQQVSNFGQGTGGSLQNQMARMLPQIQGLKGTLNNAGSAANAAAIFMKDFERPLVSTENLARRQQGANAAYAQLAGGVSASAAAPRKVTYGPSVNVENMLTLAEQLSGTPYTKAGHATAFNETVAQIKKFGTDCSGLVSVLLKEGISGIKAAQTTQGLPTAAGLAPGPGKYVTVFDRHTGAVDNEHTFIEILGKYFEEGGVLQNHAAEMTKAQVAQEFAGGGFEAFHPTSAALNTAVAGGATGAAAGPSAASSAAALQTAIDAFIASLNKAANALIATYQNLEQSGTLKTLTKALGLSTAGIDTTQRVLQPGTNANLITTTGMQYHFDPSGKPLFQAPTFPGTNMVTTTGQDYRRTGTPGNGLHFQYLGTPSTMAPHPTFAAELRTAVEGLSTSKILGNLNAGQDPHQLDKQLVPILGRASAGSAPEKNYESTVVALIAAGQTKEANALVAAHKAVMATLAQEIFAEQVNKDGELLNLEATQLKDQTQLAQDSATAQLNVLKAQQQKADDYLNAQVIAVKDMTQIMVDQGAQMVQAIQDASQSMVDALDAVATGISDQTQIQVDILGERGLYGLNLIAQQLRVNADEVKAYWDQQIAAAKQNVDAVTAQAHQAAALAQINLDQVTAQENLLVAAAQQTMDQVTIIQTQRIATATAHVDAVTLHEDASVVGPAQMAVDLGATLPKSQQDVLNGILKRAQGQAGMAEGQAGAALTAVSDAAGKAIQDATNAYTVAQANAASAEAYASQTLTSVTNAGNAALATAQSALTYIQGQAGIAEASATGAADVAGARASTEFAGTGTVVNIYGIPVENATAVADALSWVARTSLAFA